MGASSFLFIKYANSVPRRAVFISIIFENVKIAPGPERISTDARLSSVVKFAPFEGSSYLIWAKHERCLALP